MESDGVGASSSDQDGRELALSGVELAELVRGVGERGAPVRFRARGLSMSPFIKDGDVVTVSPLPQATPGLGRVIAFAHPVTGELVVHRAIGRRGDDCLTRGDRAARPDALVPRANILGHVTRVERDGRSLRLGLGPGRFALALLSRMGQLTRVLAPVRKLVKLAVRRPGGRQE